MTVTLNLGPTHPATHGVFQNIIEIDGEPDPETIFKQILAALDIA